MTFYAIERLKNLEFQENVFVISRMTRAENFLGQNFFGNYFCSCFMLPRSFWAEICFSVFEVQTYTFRYTDSRLPLCSASSEAGALPSDVRIENDSDRKLSKSKILKVFLETTFLQCSCYSDHYESKMFFGT